MRTTKQAGFSLLELSFVLIVFGAIAGMTIVLGTKWLEQEKVNTTKDNITLIEAALDSYRKRNKRLPCPAPLAAVLGDADYGVEADNPGACTGGAIQSNATTSANVFFGAVPITTLGMSKSLMLDAWDRGLVYYVDIGLTVEDSLDPREAAYVAVDDGAIGDIQVQDETGADRTTQAVYAIVSFGENGHGAYLRSGNRFDGGDGISAEEIENCNCNDDAVTTGAAPFNNDNILVQKFLEADFDDIVKFKERYQLYDKIEQ
ncbi:MAG: type II secretion system GspH family protein [Rickettsiales bacterium]|nr:type II secretion system GspH family protein [Rickettsiales bacterium]